MNAELIEEIADRYRGHPATPETLSRIQGELDGNQTGVIVDYCVETAALTISPRPPEDPVSYAVVELQALEDEEFITRLTNFNPLDYPNRPDAPVSITPSVGPRLLNLRADYDGDTPPLYRGIDADLLVLDDSPFRAMLGTSFNMDQYLDDSALTTPTIQGRPLGTGETETGDVILPAVESPYDIIDPEQGMIVNNLARTVEYEYIGTEWVLSFHGEPEIAPPDITLPDVFPTEQEVHQMLLNAVRVCIGSNVLNPMVSLLEPSLGEKASIFNDSILFKEIGMGGSLDLFQGRVAIQQFVGKVLHDDEVMSAFIGPQVNSLVNKGSMRDTRVYHSSGDSSSVRVEHLMPYSASACRYLRNSLARTRLVGEDLMKVTWLIPYDGSDMSGLMYTAEHLASALQIYFKLLTRFPSCQSYQNSLPSFRNS